MRTWIIWRALNHPQVMSPFFVRVIDPAVYGKRRHRTLSLQLPLVLVLILLVPLLWLLPWLALPALITLFNANFAANIGEIATREREQQTYDILCLSPYGTMGIHWALCKGCYVRARTKQGEALFNFLMLVSIILGAFAGISTPSGVSMAFAFTIMVACVLNIDFVQSSVIATLLGMATINADHYTDLRFRLLGSFLLVQITLYVFVFLIGFFTLSSVDLIGVLYRGDLFAAMMFLFVAGFTLYVLREILINLLWYSIKRRLNADETDFKQVFSR